MNHLAKQIPDFWHGKRVLLTGHTGFKGAWMALKLHKLGAQVTGLSLPPSTTPNLFGLANIQDVSTSHFCDIRDETALANLINIAQPEIVFHLAAQALVRTSYRDPLPQMCKEPPICLMHCVHWTLFGWWSSSQPIKSIRT